MHPASQSISSNKAEQPLLPRQNTGGGCFCLMWLLLSPPLRIFIYHRTMLDDKNFYRIPFDPENNTIIANAKFSVSFERAPQGFPVRLWPSSKFLFDRVSNSFFPSRRQLWNIFLNYTVMVDDLKHLPSFFMRSKSSALSITFFGDFIPNHVFFNFKSRGHKMCRLRSRRHTIAPG